MDAKIEGRRQEEEVRETKEALFGLLIGEGPLVAILGALLAALGFGSQRRRRRSKPAH